MPTTLPDAPHALSAAEVIARLDVRPETGLEHGEVLRRRRLHGRNLLAGRKPRRALAILAHQFRGVIVWLLTAAAALSFGLGDLVEAAAIAVVLVINTGIGFFTELRAARSMEALSRIAEMRTLVRRGGRLLEVAASDLVPGDVVVLRAGDVVTADLRLIEANGIECDESVLTGEALPVAKGIEPVAEDAMLPDRFSLVFKGTSLTRGSGEAIVVRTGMATELGGVSRLVAEAQGEATPLERRLDRLGHGLLWLTLAFAVLTVMAGLLRGHVVSDIIQTGIALAVAAVPEGLPVVATLSLAQGMWRMARRHALVNRLSSVETLGATTMILTDKTGTLTENRMAVERYLLDGRDIDIPPNGPVSVEDDAALAEAIRIGRLCNEAAPDGTQGDPMERALVAVAQRAGGETNAAHRVLLHAFDPARRLMASVDEDGDGYVYAVKGAPEAVIGAASTVLGADGKPRELKPQERDVWMARNGQAASAGLRCLGLAIKHAAGPGMDPYSGLTLVALVALSDPLREDVPGAIAACRSAGIRVVMLTGDHADTAARIAADAGICDGAPDVIEGAALRGFDPGTQDVALAARVTGADVFARVTPELKLALVTFHQRRGEVVAMTGDGVNDAPALRKSDIGVAMGGRGTQVAREAADMVLQDDSFPTIVAAVHEGRIIFENIRKFVVYLLSCNLGEVLVVGAAVGLGLPAPLVPLQILFLNLVTDVFPAFALGLGPGDGGIMRRAPRPPQEPILTRHLWTRIVLLGLSVAAATLAAYAGALFVLGLPADQSVTVAFVTLSLAQLWNVANVRAPGSGGVLSNEITRNVFVWAAIGLCLVLLAAALWHPGLARLLQLPDPGSEGLLLAGLASLGPLATGQGLLLLDRRTPSRAP